MYSQKLKQVVKDYIEDFNAKKDLPCVVKGSLPIPWYGSLDAYFASDVRVVTMTPNPVAEEFAEERFAPVDLSDAARAVDPLINSLNAYFTKNPNLGYFDHYEKVLQSIGCSYFEGEALNNAVQINVFSDIATSFVWNQLDPDDQKKLINITLFKRMINELDPDIMLFSIHQDVFDMLFGDWEPLELCQIGKVGYVNAYMRGGRLIINGRNFIGAPFGGMKAEEVHKAIIKILKKFQASLERA